MCIIKAKELNIESSLDSIGMAMKFNYFFLKEFKARAQTLV